MKRTRLSDVNRAKYLRQGYPGSQLGPSGLPKSHVRKHPSKKSAFQQATRESAIKARASKHRPHRHLPYNHAHAVNEKGKITNTKPGHPKVKHAWGKKAARLNQQQLTRQRFRQPKQTPVAATTPGPNRNRLTPTPVRTPTRTPSRPR